MIHIFSPPFQPKDPWDETKFLLEMGHQLIRRDFNTVDGSEILHQLIW